MIIQQKQEEDIFVCIEQWCREYQNKVIKNSKQLPLIDLSVGNPDLPPNEIWKKKLCSAIQQQDMHGYADFTPEINQKLRASFSDYFNRRFISDDRYTIEAEKHVIDFAGSKEGIFFSLFCLLSPGDTVLMPDPSYSVYHSCIQKIGAKVEFFSCDIKGQPDLSSITAAQLSKAQLMVLCSPNNPTTDSIEESVLDEILAFAEQHKLTIILDRAYAEIQFTNTPFAKNLPGSLLSRPKALERVIELHSLSKSCSIAGWRVGFIVGAESIINKLKSIRFNTNFGLFLPIQAVVTDMLDSLEEIAQQNSIIYEQRINYFINQLSEAGWNIAKPKGTFFIWTPVPKTIKSMSDRTFVKELLNETGVLISPGSGFGSAGSNYVRIALVQNEEKLKEAASRIKRWLNRITV
ncbi:pyridoxal phosphate-dependent aminotransferase [Arsenophonus nasoniae]|uniref:Aminotransferase n=1 Tax=Arsenophonus nasoniae TaxID=638 RepID=A0AA95GCY1_9GAMM|nr:pyridoxal phosphate-dependent aminotransferase [Arsenophonus nasoniae]WGL94753.1 pyridoxal phosphate-dependent aminotransferase [Arsenophonus nasoniae]